MATNTPALLLSPSEFHLRLMARTRPALAFPKGAVTPAAASSWRRKLRAKIAELTGADAMLAAPRVPLRPRTLWRRRHELGTIEKVAFAAEPGADVLAYVCIPHGSSAPHDFVICLQGHSTGMHVSIGVDREDETQPKAPEGDRGIALGAMRRGVAALCIEQRSFGLRRELKQTLRAEHPCHDAVFHALMLGRTLIAERVFDIDRGIDYLARRGDAAMDRIGIMGNSGGGTATIFSAALLPRIAWAMPSCSLCTFADSLMRIYHCGDNYVPGILNWAEAADVMGLFAPRPLTVVAGRTDEIFPLAGVEKAFRSLKRIYRAAGAADQCRLVIGEGGHRFYEQLGWDAMDALRPRCR